MVKGGESMLGKNKSSASDVEARVKVGTILGAGAVFEGDFKAPEAVRIDGTVNGNCTCDKELIIGKNGHVKGNISAQHVIISGRVDGDIAAQGKLELLSTGRIVGNISARSLVIDEGASFDGRCSMTDSQSNGAAKKSDSQPEAAASDSDQK